MPEFIITSPDGQKFRITAPEGATADQLPDLSGGARGPSYSAGQSALEGYLKGASANWRDEIRGASVASGLPEWLGGFRAPIGAARLAQERNRGQIGFGGTVLGGSGKQAPGGVSSLVTGDARGPVEKQYEQARDEARRREAEMQRQNPAAFMAGELGGAVAGSLALPAGAPAANFGRRIGQAAARGAGYGAVAGAGEGEGLEGRAGGAVSGGITGAGFGAAGGAVTEALAPLARKVTNTWRGMRDPEAEASRRVAQSVIADRARSGGSPFSPEEAAEMNVAGTERALVDEGERTRALARSAANTSPEARQALTDFIQPRFEQQPERIAGHVRGMVGGPHAADTMEALQTAAQRANRPAYDRAYQAGENGIWSDRLARMVGNSPAIQRAMANAVERGRDRATAEGYGAFNPGVTFEGGVLKFGQGKGAPPYPNTQFWDYTQRELRDMQTAAARAGRNEEAGAIGTLRRQLLEEIDRANPAFAQARRGAAQFFGAENALEAGQNFVRSTASIPEARRAVARMSAAERELFARGYASSLIDLVERSGANRDVLNATFFNNTAARERTLLALGRQRADRLEALLRAERLVDLARRAMGNSTTARQLAEMGLAGGTGALADVVVERDLNPAHMAASAIAVNLARSGLGHVNQRVAQRVGEMLVSGDPDIVNRGVAIMAEQPALLTALRRATGAVAAAATGQVTDALAPGYGDALAQ